MVAISDPSRHRLQSHGLLRRRCLALLALTIAAAAARQKCEAFSPSRAAAAPPKFGNPPIRNHRALVLKALRPYNYYEQQQQKRRLCSRSASSIMFSSPANDNHTDADKEGVDKIHYIQPYLKQLFLLCRPINFPIVAIFHLLGVHQAVQLWESTSAAASAMSSPSSLLLPLLKHPSMLMVLLSLLLVTSTSMITNDYYDARNGVDSISNDDTGNDNDDEHYHPLARGEVPFSVTKTFDSYLYAILLLSSAFVPGVISRLMVLGGAIITYLYTVHLKPKTWIKNLSCAGLVAMSPVTSGLAAWSVLCNRSFLKGTIGAGVDAAATASTLSFNLILKSPLSFLVVSLFAGIMSREILMDITDCEGDAKAGIDTLPVRYGKSVAARVALTCSSISGISACGASLIPWIQRLREGGAFLGNLTAMPSLSSLATLLANSEVRNMALAFFGSGMLLQRTFSVWRTKGEDANLAERAIRESLISVLLVLASFG